MSLGHSGANSRSSRAVPGSSRPILDHPGPFLHPRGCLLDHRGAIPDHRDDSKCTAMQFWIIPMIQNAPRCILNHLDTIRRTLGNVQSVQILVTDRIGSVQNRFGSSFSTFEVRPETFSRVRGRFSSIQNCIAMIQNCIAMIRWITGVRQNASGYISNHRGAPECIGVHFESSR